MSKSEEIQNLLAEAGEKLVEAAQLAADAQETTKELAALASQTGTDSSIEGASLIGSENEKFQESIAATQEVLEGVLNAVIAFQQG